MAARKKKAAKKRAAGKARSGSGRKRTKPRPAGGAKTRPRSRAKARPAGGAKTRPRSRPSTARGAKRASPARPEAPRDVVYTDVLHQLRSRLLSRLR